MNRMIACVSNSILHLRCFTSYCWINYALYSGLCNLTSHCWTIILYFGQFDVDAGIIWYLWTMKIGRIEIREIWRVQLAQWPTIDGFTLNMKDNIIDLWSIEVSIDMWLAIFFFLEPCDIRDLYRLKTIILVGWSVVAGLYTSTCGYGDWLIGASNATSISSCFSHQCKQYSSISCQDWYYGLELMWVHDLRSWGFSRGRKFWEKSDSAVANDKSDGNNSISIIFDGNFDRSSLSFSWHDIKSLSGLANEIFLLTESSASLREMWENSAWSTFPSALVSSKSKRRLVSGWFNPILAATASISSRVITESLFVSILQNSWRATKSLSGLANEIPRLEIAIEKTFTLWDKVFARPYIKVSKSVVDSSLSKSN